MFAITIAPFPRSSEPPRLPVSQTNGLRLARTGRYRIRDNYTRFFLLKDWESLMGLQFENLVLNNLPSLLRCLGLAQKGFGISHLLAWTRLQAFSAQSCAAWQLMSRSSKRAPWNICACRAIRHHVVRSLGSTFGSRKAQNMGNVHTPFMSPMFPPCNFTPNRMSG